MPAQTDNRDVLAYDLLYAADTARDLAGLKKCVERLNRELLRRECEVAAYMQVANEFAAIVGVSPEEVAELFREVLSDDAQYDN